MSEARAPGFQSSAAPSDLEVERDELRDRLDQIEEQAVYVFMVELGKGDRWVPWDALLRDHETARKRKSELEAHNPGLEFRVVRMMRVTLYEVMD